MLKDIEKIFGSAARVRLMRYFLSHRDESVGIIYLPNITKVGKSAVNKEVNFLKKLNFLQEMVIEEFYEVETKNKKTIKSRKLSGVALNKNFPYNDSLATVLLDFRFIDHKDITESFKNYGKIKLLILGGIFTQEIKSKLDILVVGDSLDKNGVDKVIKNIEAEMGTDLTYSAFETDEYIYRVKMYDRFLRDFVRLETVVLVDKISTTNM
jgi:hypothetical protein